jgi:hypothetical protein
MTAYQNYHKDGLEIIYIESNKFLRIMFTAIFVTAAFIIPTIVLIIFLFF